LNRLNVIQFLGGKIDRPTYAHARFAPNKPLQFRFRRPVRPSVGDKIRKQYAALLDGHTAA
jgi:hypothetical protein